MQWRGKKLRLLSCLLAVGLCLPTVLFADQLEDLRRAREDLNREQIVRAQRERYERSVKDLRPLLVTKVNQIFSLHIEKRQIALTPLIEPTQAFENRRANLIGFNSPATIAYCQWFANEPGMRKLEFLVDDFPGKLTSNVVHLVWQPNGTPTPDISLDNTVQGPADRYWRVVYSQNAVRVMLVAFSTDGSNSQQQEDTVNISEKDFVTLRQRHPTETEKWLRPIFHRLQQNSVFAADSNAAWQALVDHWPISDSTMRAVEQLTPALASADWRQRRQAGEQLAKLGRDGAAAILHLDRTQFTVEQNARLDEVLSRFSPMPAKELASLQNDPNFLLDCEYSDDATVRRLASERLQQISGRAMGIPIDGPAGVRADLIEKARITLVPASHGN
jgi:hypothetical protein